MLEEYNKKILLEHLNLNQVGMQYDLEIAKADL